MDNSNQYIHLISKYLSKQTDASEERLLFEWVEKDKQNQQQFEEFKKAWDISVKHFDTEVNDIDLDKEWSKMELKITKPKIIDLNKEPKKHKFNWLRIAASFTIFILIGSGLYYFFSPKETILSADNNIIENRLSDGTQITLNHHSSITFNDDFNKEYRKVKLKGDAYFKVHSNKTKPFIIGVGKLNIEVVGTSFYVSNLINSSDIQIIVESGIVRTYPSRNKSEPVLVHAGENVVYDVKNSKIKKTSYPDVNAIAWKTKIFKFENSTFENMINYLNGCYNTNIIIKSESLKQCMVTVSFDNQSIESVLNVLKATLDIQVEKKDDMIEISGNGCRNDKKEEISN
jgi:transmembrane sensor